MSDPSNSPSLRHLFIYDAEELEERLPFATFCGNLTSVMASVAALLCGSREHTAGNPHAEEDMKRGLELLVASPRVEPLDPLGVWRNIRRWALEGLRDEQLPDLLQHLASSSPDNNNRMVLTRSLSAQQARGVLANAMLGNCLDPMEAHKDRFGVGGLDICKLLHGHAHDKIGIAKLECLMVYFATSEDLEGTEEDNRQITFERICFTPFAQPNTSYNNTIASNDGKSHRYVGEGVVIHDGSMEKPTRKAGAFVNFANPCYGYGKIIRSCTQEEILLMVCPELLVGMLFIGKMGDNEVVDVHGIRRFTQYSGYLKRFACLGPTATMDDDRRTVESNIQTILTLDACFRGHFSTDMILRDLNKAYHSFAQYQAEATKEHAGYYPVISTGKWGCGAFGGKPAHKFLQQVLAAHLAGVDLDFACFGSQDDCDTLLAALAEHQPSAERVFQLLCKCRDAETFVQDAVFFLKLKQHPNGLCNIL